MRTIKRIHEAEYHPIADLITYSPLPSPRLQHIDPFLFLNHHGYQVYPPLNNGLPFGPHPHRGMETVTFIVAGDIMHKDSEGFQSVIQAGGVQWMTAGRGLIHAEVSSDAFKKEGGELEILQLWLNLPTRLKMTPPNYVGLQKEDIPAIAINEQVTLNLIAGDWQGQAGGFTPLTEIFLSTVDFAAGGSWTLDIPTDHTIFCYLIRGEMVINGQEVAFRHLVEFDNNHPTLTLEATTDALLILGHAKPFREPIVARGPFVMNSDTEILTAYRDYQQGKFGTWTE